MVAVVVQDEHHHVGDVEGGFVGVAGIEQGAAAAVAQIQLFDGAVGVDGGEEVDRLVVNLLRHEAVSEDVTEGEQVGLTASPAFVAQLRVFAHALGQLGSPYPVVSRAPGWGRAASAS